MPVGVGFVATIEIADGVPKVTWSPDLGAERVYPVLGAREIGSAPTRDASGTSAVAEWAWEPVTEETKGNYKFFKVAFHRRIYCSGSKIV